MIVEPVAGSAGVLVPPKGYLERLREICTQHGILLIFDEVITGFGRLGQPFAAQHFGVVPDLFTTAKGLTNGDGADGRGVRRNGHLRGLHAGAGERASSSSTATPIPATRLPAPPASPRSTSTRRKACSTRAARSSQVLGRRARTR